MAARATYTPERRWIWAFAASLGWASLGCTGSIGVPESEGAVDGSVTSDGSSATTTTGGAPPATDCQSPSPGTAPLRRLSNAEYKNSLSDLFAGVSGIEELVAQATLDLPAESESLGFRNSAELLTVQPLLAQKYMDAAEQVAALVARSDGIVPCDPSTDGESACASAFISELGRRVYRRPLTAGEATRYQVLLETALTEYDFYTGVEWVIFTMLQSPQFLHRVETGVATLDGGITQPTPHEMATRLAYLFWQSTPDDDLLQSAVASGLDTADEVESLARQMLQDPRSERVFQFFAEWLDLDHLTSFDRDPAIFPDLPSALPHWFFEETRHFVQQLLARPDAGFSELFTAPYSYVNAGLAEHYGMAPPAGDGFVRVEAPDRSGVLTQAMLLAHDKPYRTSIVRRGLKVRTDLLCQTVPAPPNDVPLDIDGVGNDLSQRERLEQHRANAACAACHDALDPIGLALEAFDAVGRMRSVDEAGDAIDTNTELTGTLDADGPISGARDLGARLAQSSDARDCYVTQNFRFFFGREVEAADACSMTHLREAFSETNHSLSELLVSLTQTDAFLYRPAISGGAP